MNILAYQFYSEGFFGYGVQGDFKYWSWMHFLPIVLMIVAIVLIYFLKDKIKNWKHEENFRFIFIFIMLLFEMGYFWRLVYVGDETGKELMLSKLPVQVCQWSLIACVFMMAKKSQRLFSYCYFVSLTLGILPLFMPAVITRTGPTYFRYYQFWGEHCLPIIGIFYMMFVHDFKPKYKQIVYPCVFLLLLAFLCIYLNNTIEGANYMYLAKATDGDSIANLLPENQYLRIGIMIPLSFMLFTLAYLPFFIKNKRKNNENL